MLRTNQNKTRNLIYKRTEIITLKLKGTANNVKPCMQLQFLWYFCTPSLCNRQTDKQTVTQTIYHLRTDSLSLSSSDDHIRCDKERIIFLQKTSNCNITNLTTDCVQLSHVKTSPSHVQTAKLHRLQVCNLVATRIRLQHGNVMDPDLSGTDHSNCSGAWRIQHRGCQKGLRPSKVKYTWICIAHHRNYL